VTWSELGRVAAREPVVWKNPRAFALLAGCLLVVWVHFHLRPLRAPTMRFSRVDDLRPARPGWVSRLSSLPSVFRIVALGLIVAYKTLHAIVSDLAIGDGPEMGTAIGDALGLALGSLRRSEAASKVVILVSDGDSNVARVLDPIEAKEIATQMGVRVFTVLV